MTQFQGPNGLHYERIGPGCYRTICDHHAETGIQAGPVMSAEAGIRLFSDGWMTIRAGYVWDGPSGPSIHSASFMRGSLYHDALYDLMRQKLLGLEYRQAADDLLRRVCRQDGMTAIRAAWVYAGVRAFGGKYAGAAPHAAARRDR